MSEYTDINVSERYTDNVKMNIRVEKQLCSIQSEFQRIEVLSHRSLGVS